MASPALLILGWLAGTADPARADAVVIAATAPGFAAGQQLGDAPIAVPDGASLIFLLATGQVVTVKGPYDGPPPAPKAEAGGRFGKMARLGGVDQSQIGGTRAIPAIAALARNVPLDLYLATDRGRYPAYRAGEPIRLVLQTNRDAYTYCWLRAGPARVVPLFPSRAEEAGLLPGGVTLRLPAEGQGGLAAEPRLDEAELRCMAALAPLAPDLVQGFLAAGGKALPAALAERLDAALPVRDRDGQERDVVLAQLVLKVQGP